MLVPYTIEQDGDGVWCARAVLRPGVSASGEGDTPDAALAELRAAFALLTEKFDTSAELM
ncbi:hypothetical protein NE857_27665 [Nocardiopsis exhalans]|uniref:Type II toxin-antitoxin system HicB family antitoxin n=1 Tax=Nocardiopsis exhalans TaxID=163604 RepID=A0ABY5D4T9_9ACTN|nr:hypothetical protein [Nocardiopsis exhalans]USY19012.1 hypothetical protein NE857_27665 [Nocardiopsis exhalans]